MRAYAEEYLNDVVENQGKLFDFVAQMYPDKDTKEFINTYMASKTRKSIDVGIQSERLILCQYAYRIHSRINTIRKGKIDNAVLTSKCNGRLGNLGCQNTKTASLSSSQ